MLELLNYSLNQIEHLLEAAKVLLSVSTGFILLVSSSISKFKDQKIKLFSMKNSVISVYLWSILSIGLWSGVIAFVIDCSSPFDRIQNSSVPLNISQLNWEFSVAILTAKFALISQFISISFYSYIAYKVFVKNYLI